MKNPVLIPYECRSCKSSEAELSAKGMRLKCAACGRDQGLLSDIRAALREEARLQAADKARKVYPRRMARAAGQIACKGEAAA